MNIQTIGTPVVVETSVRRRVALTPQEVVAFKQTSEAAAAIIEEGFSELLPGPHHFHVSHAQLWPANERGPQAISLLGALTDETGKVEWGRRMRIRDQEGVDGALFDLYKGKCGEGTPGFDIAFPNGVRLSRMMFEASNGGAPRAYRYIQIPRDEEAFSAVEWIATKKTVPVRKDPEAKAWAAKALEKYRK